MSSTVNSRHLPPQVTLRPGAFPASRGETTDLIFQWRQALPSLIATGELLSLAMDWDSGGSRGA